MICGCDGLQRRPLQHVAGVLRAAVAPIYGVFEPHTRRVYVNDPDNIAGVGALLDALLASER
jgi:hypothetical protein